MARLFRFAIKREGSQGKSMLSFTSNYSPEVGWNGLDKVEIEFENDSNRGIRLELTREEANEIKRQLEKQGI
jgi:hypothetical protein